MSDDVRLIARTTHGRVLVREPVEGPSRGLLVGFHGYLENAAIQMERLVTTPSADAWTLMSIQGLHRVYRGRTDQVVASWMTREDREAMMADNIAYVDRAIETVPAHVRRRIVHVGFSQGVAMAFRAGVRGRFRADRIIAIGGDVPPDLLADTEARYPRLLLARGERDEWYTQPKLDADVAALEARGVAVTSRVFDGAREWNEAFRTIAGELLAGVD